MNRPVLGIDPGVNGGATILNAAGQIIFLHPFRPTMTEKDCVLLVWSAVTVLRKEVGNVCYFEKVGVMPHDGKVGAFSFGKINGLIRGALLAYDIEVRLVPPMIWMSRIEGAMTGGSKNVTKNKAKELFPSHADKMTHAVADSVLIALYGWRQMAQETT